MRISIISLFLLFTLSLQAQSSMSDINRIKRDKNFLYGEATLDSREAALKLAYELLEAEIKNWAAQKNAGINSVLASHVYEYADTIVLPRGNMFRAFSYVKVSNLKTIKGKDMVVMVEATGKKNVKQSEPEVGESPENKVAEEKAVPPVKQEQVPVVEEKKETAPMKAPDKEVVAPKKTVEETVVERLMNVQSFYDLEKTIKPLKEEGLIQDYGKYATMKDPDNCYLIIYDQQATVKAILGKGTTSRKNMKTGLDDSEKNYSGCGAIWVKIACASNRPKE